LEFQFRATKQRRHNVRNRREIIILQLFSPKKWWHIDEDDQNFAEKKYQENHSCIMTLGPEGKRREPNKITWGK